MPTENERKFVLNLNTNFIGIPKNELEIRQGYLMTSRGMTLRFRHIHYHEKKKNKYVMTFKCNTGKRVVELEKKIDKRDFEDVWVYCMNTVYKTRVLLDGWEIDFFRDHNSEIYFVMAEIEMPEGMDRPNKIPEFISNNLLYEVPRDDSRFSSKMLSDPRYAREMYHVLEESLD